MVTAVYTVPWLASAVGYNVRIGDNATPGSGSYEIYLLSLRDDLGHNFDWGKAGRPYYGQNVREPPNQTFELKFQFVAYVTTSLTVLNALKVAIVYWRKNNLLPYIYYTDKTGMATGPTDANNRLKWPNWNTPTTLDPIKIAIRSVKQKHAGNERIELDWTVERRTL